jgi:hypothetical protein
MGHKLLGHDPTEAASTAGYDCRARVHGRYLGALVSNDSVAGPIGKFIETQNYTSADALSSAFSDDFNTESIVSELSNLIDKRYRSRYCRKNCALLVCRFLFRRCPDITGGEVSVSISICQERRIIFSKRGPDEKA